MTRRDRMAEAVRRHAAEVYRERYEELSHELSRAKADVRARSLRRLRELADEAAPVVARLRQGLRALLREVGMDPDMVDVRIQATVGDGRTVAVSLTSPEILVRHVEEAAPRVRALKYSLRLLDGERFEYEERLLNELKEARTLHAKRAILEREGIPVLGEVAMHVG